MPHTVAPSASQVVQIARSEATPKTSKLPVRREAAASGALAAKTPPMYSQSLLVPCLPPQCHTQLWLQRKQRTVVSADGFGNTTPRKGSVCSGRHRCHVSKHGVRPAGGIHASVNIRLLVHPDPDDSDVKIANFCLERCMTIEGGTASHLGQQQRHQDGSCRVLLQPLVLQGQTVHCCAARTRKGSIQQSHPRILSTVCRHS